ncbi:hypothetical protein PAHAL_6G074100 [Panicum hallii]|uniref:BTB domain-containing protein n=1 Tax=Panicum hallii TaxID=206008 RepID=A0A2S3I1U2_9POAL|nr:hypothetical protein PAHAL_6G074100 [Panicum hallii]
MSSESRNTASSITEADSGTYTFEIDGYSLKIRSVGVGDFVRSGTFTVGGLDWAIRFYPNGIHKGSKQFFIASLELMSSNAEARARYVLGLCELTVIRESLLSENRAESEIEVPPSDMMEHFGNLLKEKKGVDVTFRVGGKTFEAHKIVLAARSPVFKAEFFGPMRESGTCCVTVEDMHPEVFSAQLHFIYNDLLPDMGDLEGNDYHEMMWHLLVAADRYAMDRMKLVCQSIICKNLHLETVAATLALAVQHNCDRLKAACIEFIAFPNNKDAVAVTKVMRISKGCALLCSLIYLREKVSSHNRDE